MGMYHNRPHVEDIRKMKKNGEKIPMLFVTTPDEAAAANAAGIHMLSIERKFFDAIMREAAGSCFVQVGCPMAVGVTSMDAPWPQQKTICGLHSTMLQLAVMLITAQRHMTSRKRCVTTTSLSFVTLA